MALSVKVLIVCFFGLMALTMAHPGYLSSGISSYSYQQPIISKQIVPVVRKQIVPVVTKQVVPVVQYKQVYSSSGGGYGYHQ